MPRVGRGRLRPPREQGALANQALETVVSFVELSLQLDTSRHSKVKRQFRKPRKEPTEGEVLQGSEERNLTCGFLGKRVTDIYLPLDTV